MTTPPSDRIVRFDAAERVVHWANALLFAVLLATAAALYIPRVSVLVGRRDLVKQVHVWTGLALPFPLLLGLAGRWRRGLAADLVLLNRLDVDDRRWLRGRRGARPGKFNAGQKLNAAFVGGAIAVMLMTGAVMRWYDPFPLSWRTGATFVHDLLALALAVAIAGHIGLAVRDRHALAAMIRGWVTRDWAERKAPRWAVDEGPDG